MTTTKPTAAPYATAYTNAKGLLTTTTAQISYDAAAVADFKLLSSFKAYIIGQSSAEESPTKDMTKWSTDTAATRKTAGVDIGTNVSSYAIIVDVTTKAKIGGAGWCGTVSATAVAQA